jgi:molybdopterin-synthase adenylyltransferase
MIIERFSRQSFLGADAQERIAACTVGILGVGGGGSHIVQQLAHIGFADFVVYDPETIEESNLNRMVGATEADVAANRPKVETAQRLILGLRPHARIEPHQKRWQDEPLPLRRCDLLFGCVDGLAERRELEACTRRYLVPFIDIGLDVHRVGDAPPAMAGQVILSMPGEPCMTCMGFLTDDALAREAARYGMAGPRPQVIWANGVLASLAVGLAVDLLTDWTGSLRGFRYLSYDANQPLVGPHIRTKFAKELCRHYPLGQIGDPRLLAL